MEENDARTYALFTHLAALSCFVIPLGFILGPLVMWLIKKDEHPLIDFHGRQAMNLAVTMIIAAVVLVGAGFVLVLSIGGIILLPMLILLAVGVGTWWLVALIVAAMAAQRGEYRAVAAIPFFGGHAA